MSYLAINSIGLLFDIAGVVLLFNFGLPEKVSRSGTSALLLQGTDFAEKAKAEKYDRWGRCGVVLLTTGFGLQIASNWMQAVQQAGP